MRTIDNNPNKESSLSQQKRILACLQRGEELTSASMYGMFGAVDGRKRISELRAKGVPVKTRPGYNPSTKKHYSIYYLEG